MAGVHGATYALNPTHHNVPEVVLHITGGIGVDIAFDAAGVQTSVDTAIASVRPRGTVVNVASWDELPKIEMNRLVSKEITLIGLIHFPCAGILTIDFITTGSIAYDRNHPEVLIAVAARKISGIEDLITSKIAMEDIIGKGFQTLLDDKASQGKKFQIYSPARI
jgi:threonine dehydrogenase-like Zn-dependent dehydrogenase